MNSTSIDKNNVESGMYLPEDLRYYVDSVHYVHKYGIFAQALKASNMILSAWPYFTILSYAISVAMDTDS